VQNIAKRRRQKVGNAADTGVGADLFVHDQPHRHGRYAHVDVYLLELVIAVSYQGLREADTGSG
jgi:hypothetical protein